MANYRRILVPIHGTVLADLAYQKAKRYAKQTNAHLIVLSVVDTSGIAMHDYGGGFEIDPLMNTAKEFLEDYAEDAAKDNINCKTIIEVGSAKNAILETAKDQNADLIMMGQVVRTHLPVYSSVLQLILSFKIQKWMYS